MKWGIVGAGKIARRFAADLPLTSGGSIGGVFSRSVENSTRFASEFGTRTFESFESLIANIDIVYIATPHPSHKTFARAAIELGKPILCEKPFTMTAQDAEDVFQLAAKRRVFVMEAMWTRFFPAIEETLRIVHSGAIGQLVTVMSSFGYSTAFDPVSRVFNAELGGGSLLDVGVYCVALAAMLAEGVPVVRRAQAELPRTGVDQSAVWSLQFPSGARAVGESSVVKVLLNSASIQGNAGSIQIPNFWHPKELIFNGESRPFPYTGGGFQFEADEVMNCIRAGKIQSDKLPWSDTIRTLRCMDEIRARCLDAHSPAPA